MDSGKYNIVKQRKSSAGKKSRTGILSTSTDENDNPMESLESTNSDEEIFDFHWGKNHRYIRRLL